ncbi:MAG: hypothetical protein ABIY51_06175 [Ferruginibacter sp.]
MTSQELVKKIFLTAGRFKLVIIVGGLLVGAALFLYARSKPIVYTSRASVFPLNAASDNSLANSALSQLMGGVEAPKSFSQEATINIVELALSRNTREAVVMERLPEKGNKRIVDLLIENYNKTKPFYSKAIVAPTDEVSLAASGGMMLKGGIAAKINKNGILEVTYSNTDASLVSPISYVLIEKIGQFYKDLKIKKAQVDYNFTVRKMDSLQRVLNTYDRRAIGMSNSTLFVPNEKIEYSIPKENLINQKTRVLGQFNGSANNREEALWRLQKVTPIIEILDKPDPPFDVTKSSSMVFGIIGFIAGVILFTLILISPLLYRYAKAEIYRSVFKDETMNDNTTTSSSAVV